MAAELELRIRFVFGCGTSGQSGDAHNSPSGYGEVGTPSQLDFFLSFEHFLLTS
jgi:hypothetical protein